MLTNLPADLQSRIFSFLSLQARGRLRQCCTATFRSLESFERELLLQQLPSSDTNEPNSSSLRDELVASTELKRWLTTRTTQAAPPSNNVLLHHSGPPNLRRVTEGDFDDPPQFGSDWADYHASSKREFRFYDDAPKLIDDHILVLYSSYWYSFEAFDLNTGKAVEIDDMNGPDKYYVNTEDERISLELMHYDGRHKLLAAGMETCCRPSSNPHGPWSGPYLTVWEIGKPGDNIRLRADLRKPQYNVCAVSVVSPKRCAVLLSLSRQRRVGAAEEKKDDDDDAVVLQWHRIPSNCDEMSQTPPPPPAGQQQQGNKNNNEYPWWPGTSTLLRQDTITRQAPENGQSFMHSDGKGMLVVITGSEVQFWHVGTMTHVRSSNPFQKESLQECFGPDVIVRNFTTHTIVRPKQDRPGEGYESQLARELRRREAQVQPPQQQQGLFPPAPVFFAPPGLPPQAFMGQNVQNLFAPVGMHALYQNPPNYYAHPFHLGQADMMFNPLGVYQPALYQQQQALYAAVQLQAAQQQHLYYHQHQQQQARYAALAQQQPGGMYYGNLAAYGSQQQPAPPQYRHPVAQQQGVQGGGVQQRRTYPLQQQHEVINSQHQQQYQYNPQQLQRPVQRYEQAHEIARTTNHNAEGVGHGSSSRNDFDLAQCDTESILRRFAHETRAQQRDFERGICGIHGGRLIEREIQLPAGTCSPQLECVVRVVFSVHDRNGGQLNRIALMDVEPFRFIRERNGEDNGEDSFSQEYADACLGKKGLWTSHRTCFLPDRDETNCEWIRVFSWERGGILDLPDHGESDTQRFWRYEILMEGKDNEERDRIDRQFVEIEDQKVQDRAPLSLRIDAHKLIICTRNELTIWPVKLSGQPFQHHHVAPMGWWEKLNEAPCSGEFRFSFEAKTKPFPLEAKSKPWYLARPLDKQLLRSWEHITSYVYGQRRDPLSDGGERRRGQTVDFQTIVRDVVTASPENEASLLYRASHSGMKIVAAAFSWRYAVLITSPDDDEGEHKLNIFDALGDWAREAHPRFQFERDGRAESAAGNYTRERASRRGISRKVGIYLKNSSDQERPSESIDSSDDDWSSAQDSSDDDWSSAQSY